MLTENSGLLLLTVVLTRGKEIGRRVHKVYPKNDAQGTMVGMLQFLINLRARAQSNEGYLFQMYLFSFRLVYGVLLQSQHSSYMQLK